MKTLEWTPENVRAFWSGVAQTRLNELSFGLIAGDIFVEKVRPYLSKDARHLDFGAGDGHIVQTLMARGFPTAAYEIAPERRKHILASALARHPLFLGVVGSDDPARFDTIVMTDVVEHILDSEAGGAFGKIRQLLAPGGKLILTTPNNEDLGLSVAYCPVCDHAFHRWQHVRSFTPESLAAFLSNHGLECESVVPVDFASDSLPRRARQFRDRLLRAARATWRPAGKPPKPSSETHLLAIASVRR